VPGRSAASRDLSPPPQNVPELAPRLSNRHFVLVRDGSQGAPGEALRTFRAFRESRERAYTTACGEPAEDVQGLPAPYSTTLEPATLRAVVA
jgi:hypothetical protein